jgi:hypothetical protein
MQDAESLKDQHPAVGPGLAGALVPLLKWGKRAEISKGVLDAMRNYRGKGKGRLRQVGPCRGLHRRRLELER